MMFNELPLEAPLINSLDKIQFHKPTPVQEKAIPFLLENTDVLACAETGSGKTGAYMIPMLNSLLKNEKEKGLVLAPTRELAKQISTFLIDLLKDHRSFHVACLVGGEDIRRQFKALQKRPRIIVATPGRLIDHMHRNTAQVHNVNRLVLDEGDRMIDMGFAPQLKEILKDLPKDRQTAFFTATLDDKTKKLAKDYLHKPQLLMLSQAKPVSTIRQAIVKIDEKDKKEGLLHEITRRKGSMIVFLKTKRRTDQVQKYLSEYGVSVGLIHGGRTQGQRNKALDYFKNGKSQVLCATDVAARGIDVPHVEHVINFDLPMQDEDYVHRVGRTARNGAEGEALSFVTPQEYRAWNRIVKKYEIKDAMIEGVTSSRKSARSDRPEGRPARKPSGKKFGARKARSNDEKSEWSERSERSEGRPARKPSGKKFGARKARSNDERSEWSERSEGRPARKTDGKKASSKKFGAKKASGSKKTTSKKTFGAKKKSQFGASKKKSKFFSRSKK